MKADIRQLSLSARQAAARQDWQTVQRCGRSLIERFPDDAEGYFLLGLAEKAAERPRHAESAFEKALSLDDSRYDAAVELASQYSMARRNAEVAALLERYTDKMSASPKYLEAAATVYTQVGLPDKAWPLYLKANELQSGVPVIEANLAACAVYVGEFEKAQETFESLLARFPNHQRNHYQLSRLRKARDETHIEQMRALLKANPQPEDRNIFMYYAIAKEYEDLGDWDNAFRYFERAGNAVMSVADYDIASDVAIIDAAIEVCNAEWLVEAGQGPSYPHTPLFVVGLPRTGTTLTERILSSHSQVESVGETEFMQMVIRRESGIPGIEKMNPEMIRATADVDADVIAKGYMDAVGYRLGDAPFFVDKLPFNVLYLGFIAKAWPDQPVVLLRRHPMDACFAMFKQVFTWAYKFSYSLDNLAEHYIAYDRLCRHWEALLGERLVTIEYEKLVRDQEAQTRHLLDAVGLTFEEACLHFERQAAPSATASSVQVRQKMHSKSVGRWRKYAEYLEPLRNKLDAAGIDVS